MDEIKEGFNQIADRYDEGRMALIPCYTDFYGIIAELAQTQKAKPAIADLGAGTGLLSALLFEKYPMASFTLIDLSANMLAIARQRFALNQNVQFIEADYARFDFTESYDIIVSSLSIHHLEHKDKWALYKKIFILLKPGGIFINGDIIKGVTATTNEIYMQQWLNKINKSGLPDEEKKSAIYRMGFDKPATVPENLQNLRDAGFTDVDIFYKYYNFGVMFGRKPQ